MLHRQRCDVAMVAVFIFHGFGFFLDEQQAESADFPFVNGEGGVDLFCAGWIEREGVVADLECDPVRFGIGGKTDMNINFAFSAVFLRVRDQFFDDEFDREQFDLGEFMIGEKRFQPPVERNEIEFFCRHLK